MAFKRPLMSPADIFIVMTGLSFILFIAGSFWLHGDAWFGFAKNGHYYLADHGKLTEVNASIWWYSYCHVVSLIFTWPVALILVIRKNILKNRH